MSVWMSRQRSAADLVDEHPRRHSGNDGLAAGTTPDGSTLDAQSSQLTSLWQRAQMAPFKQFSDNPSFRRWLTDTIFTFTYEQ